MTKSKNKSSRWEGHEVREIRVMAYMTKKEFAALKAKAMRTNISRNELICKAVEAYEERSNG